MFLADHYPPFGCGTSMPAAKDRDGPWGIHPSPIIGSGGCLATARLGVMAPRVDVAHPILDRCLPPLLGRRDVLDQASGAETQFLGHAHRLVGQSAPSLRLCPALLLTRLVRSRHDASLSRSSLLGLKQQPACVRSVENRHTSYRLRLFRNHPSWTSRPRVGRIEQRLVDAGQTIPHRRASRPALLPRSATERPKHPSASRARVTAATLGAQPWCSRTIAVPTDWLADPPASSGTPGRLALTDAALNRLVNALAGQRDGDLPEDLSPSGMASLLDAAWVKEQPWRELVERRLQDRRGSHPAFQGHQSGLQDQWNDARVGRHGDDMGRRTDGAVADQMIQDREPGANESDAMFAAQVEWGLAGRTRAARM